MHSDDQVEAMIFMFVPHEFAHALVHFGRTAYPHTRYLIAPIELVRKNIFERSASKLQILVRLYLITSILLYLQS